MDELLQEFVDSRGARLRIDRQHGVIRGVKLLGLESRNGRKYLPAALATAVGLYEGAKVNVNHPKGHPLSARDYQDRLGLVRHVSVRPGEGLFGDLHFNPKHVLAEQLLWDAEHAPHNVGLSHNVEARTSRQAGVTVVEAILKVQSVDLVADPATTAGLFEAAAAASGTGAAADEAPLDLTTLTLEQLRAARSDLVEAIEHEAAREIGELREKLEQHEAQESLRQRRGKVGQLLKEFNLPDPDDGDPAARLLVGEEFLESLLVAADEQAMRKLLAERASTAAQLGRLTSAGSRPRSRDQSLSESTPASTDAAGFARSIR